MAIVWKTLKWLLVLLSIAAACIVALVIRELFWKPRYDEGDPRYAAIAQQLSQTHQAFAAGDYSRNELDLTSLNGGKWITACVFGGYTYPLNEMTNLGAKVSSEDEGRLRELDRRGFRLSQVEEFEVMITYVDLSGDAHFVHFRHGFGPGGQHFKRCVSKPTTAVRLT